MIYLKRIAKIGNGDNAVFPFSVPSMRDCESIKIDSEVVFFVGENGSGKSTLLEGRSVALPAG